MNAELHSVLTRLIDAVQIWIYSDIIIKIDGWVDGWYGMVRGKYWLKINET